MSSNENSALVESWFLRLGGNPAAATNANVQGTLGTPTIDIAIQDDLRDLVNHEFLIQGAGPS